MYSTHTPSQSRVLLPKGDNESRSDEPRCEGTSTLPATPFPLGGSPEERPPAAAKCSAGTHTATGERAWEERGGSKLAIIYLHVHCM